MSSCYVSCTIATRDHLPAARALARSFRRFHPDMRFLVLLADRYESHLGAESEPFELITLDQLGAAAELARMAHYYTPFEFCCALRGAFFRYLMNSTDIKGWLFLDSDQFIFGSLDPVFRELELCSILLTPHVTRPPDNVEEVDRNEIHLVKNGVFNGGFLGVRRTPSSRDFVEWFEKRLQWFCFFDVGPQKWLPRGLNCDQGWLNLVPLYFDDVRACRHPGVNVGHWNLFERTLARDAEGSFTANGVPLVCFHFSGWNPDRPEMVSKHSPHWTSETIPTWNELSSVYQEALRHSGTDEERGHPCAFLALPGTETPLTIDSRREFYERCRVETPAPVSPFERLITC